MADTSIYAGTPPPNPMEQLRSMLGVAGAAQEYQSKQAVADAWKDAVNPDGTLDIEKLTRGTARSGFGAPQATSQALSVGQQQFGLRRGYQTEAMSLLASMRDQANVNSDSIKNLVMTGVRAGIFPHDIANNLIKNIPPDSRKQDQVQHLYNISEALGGGAPRPSVSITPPRAQQPVNVPAAVEAQISRGLITPSGEVPRSNQGKMYGGAPTSQPMTAEQEAKTGGDAATSLNSSANEVPLQRTQLTLMENDLKKAGAEKFFGPSAPWEKHVNLVVNRLAGFMPTMSKEDVAGLESFEKIAKQIAATQAGSLHATNDFLSNALGANPSITLSALGNTGIIHMLHGNLDAIAIKNREWRAARKAGVQPGQYWEWNDHFNSNFDPRVFQFMRMNKDEQRSLLGIVKQTDGDGGKQFENRLQDAIDNEWTPKGTKTPGITIRPVDSYRQKHMGM